MTGGAGDGRRARRLLGAINADVAYYDVDKSRPRRDSSREIWQLLSAKQYDLVMQEGTGIAGGANLIRAARSRGQRYVVSSGDPIGGFFRVTRGPLYGLLFSVYERLLYRHCDAFIGWTPYLTGMAIKMGAPRGVTIEGAVEMETFIPYEADKIRALRANLGIPATDTVLGVVGSLQWNPRHAYCYGLELVEAAKHVSRSDVTMLIVGDGSGLGELQKRVPPDLAKRIVFTGRVDQQGVVDMLNVMDVGLITQTLDGLGSYRLTTKLPEYLATGLPVAMSPIPGFYDYASEAGWPLPPYHPASEQFHRGLATWIDGIDASDIAAKSALARQIAAARFDYEDLTQRFAVFINDLMQRQPASEALTA